MVCGFALQSMASLDTYFERKLSAATRASHWDASGSRTRDSDNQIPSDVTTQHGS
jgi:hypothetical protein